MIDWKKIEEMFNEVQNRVCSKNIHETDKVRIVVYSCGTVIRIDIKEKI